MSTVRRALLLSTLFTVIPVAIGVTQSEDRNPEREATTYVGTDLADFDSASAVVQRMFFCDLIPPDAATAALGAEGSATAYHNGEKSESLPDGDVAHEYGCTYTAGASEARGWVFAPPIPLERATALVAATETPGCAVQEAPAYGTPSVALLCAEGDVVTASYRGLFGDAWLACSLSLPTGQLTESDLMAQAGRWCVAVAEAAAAPTN